MMYEISTPLKPVLSISEKCIIGKAGEFEICRPRGSTNWIKQHCVSIKVYSCTHDCVAFDGPFICELKEYDHKLFAISICIGLVLFYSYHDLRTGEERNIKEEVLNDQANGK